MKFEINLETAEELDKLLASVDVNSHSENIVRFHKSLKTYIKEMSKQDDLAKRYLKPKNS